MTPLEWFGGLAVLLAGFFTYAYTRKMPSTDNDPIVPIVVDPPTAPISPVDQSNMQTYPDARVQATSRLEAFCGFIRDFEGKPGDLNYKNNNPGNCRCSKVGYLPKYGNVKCVNNFAVFPTYALGWEYLLNLVSHRAALHPTWTILDFFTNYAPSTDGNSPMNYAKNVATKMGVGITTTLQDLFA